MSEQVVTISQVVNIGAELKRELERIARQDFNSDATWLSRRIIREWLAARTSE